MSLPRVGADFNLGGHVGFDGEQPRFGSGPERDDPGPDFEMGLGPHASAAQPLQASFQQDFNQAGPHDMPDVPDGEGELARQMGMAAADALRRENEELEQQMTLGWQESLRMPQPWYDSNSASGSQAHYASAGISPSGPSSSGLHPPRPSTPDAEQMDADQMVAFLQEWIDVHASNSASGSQAHDVSGGPSRTGHSSVPIPEQPSSPLTQAPEQSSNSNTAGSAASVGVQGAASDTDYVQKAREADQAYVALNPSAGVDERLTNLLFRGHWAAPVLEMFRQTDPVVTAKWKSTQLTSLRDEMARHIHNQISDETNDSSYAFRETAGQFRVTERRIRQSLDQNQSNSGANLGSSRPLNSAPQFDQIKKWMPAYEGLTPSLYAWPTRAAMASTDYAAYRASNRSASLQEVVTHMLDKGNGPVSVRYTLFETNKLDGAAEWTAEALTKLRNQRAVMFYNARLDENAALEPVAAHSNALEKTVAQFHVEADKVQGWLNDNQSNSSAGSGSR